MSVVYFPAIVEGGKRKGYSVFFPDLPGCVSAGDTLQAAARNAEEGLEGGHLAFMVEATRRERSRQRSSAYCPGSGCRRRWHAYSRTRDYLPAIGCCAST